MRKGTCAVCAEPMHWGTKSLPQGQARCLTCRRTAPSHPRRRGLPATQTYTCQVCSIEWSRPTVKGRVPKLCPSCREKWRNRWTLSGTCPVCHRLGIRNGGRYCSRRCASDDRRTRGPLVLYIDPPSLCVVPPRHPSRRPLQSVPSRRFYAGLCLWCGEAFTIVDSPEARYCSTRCLKKAGKTRHGHRFRVLPSVRLAIYERDRWTCQLCSLPVDPTLHGSHRWAATLDHVVCQAWTLIPDHSSANLRLTHRMCNSIRGDGTRGSLIT